MKKPFLSFVCFSLVLSSCTPATSRSRGGEMEDDAGGEQVGVPSAGPRTADASQIARDTSAAMPPATAPVEPAAGVARAEDAGRSAASIDARDGAASSPPAGAADCGKLHYCEDFEKYPVGALPGSPWAHVMSTGAFMAVDTTKPNGGTKSLHIKVPSNPTYTKASSAFVNQGPGAAVPIAGNNLFGRYMVFYSNTGTNLPPASSKVHFVNVQFFGNATVGSVNINLGGFINYGYPGGETGKGFGPGWPSPGKWHCVQWQLDSSGSPPKNQVGVWVDGVRVVDIPTSAGWHLATPWNKVKFGYEDYGGRPADVELWLDDLALSDSMVACPPAP